MSEPKKTLVLGLGNTILSDDAVGIRLAREVKERLKDRAEVDVKEASVGGLRILDLILGYSRLVLIDSIQVRDGSPGELRRLKPDDFRSVARLSSPHDVNFATALEIGRKQDLGVPTEIEIYAVEVDENQGFGENLSPKVEKAVPGIVDRIVEEQFGQNPNQAPDPQDQR